MVLKIELFRTEEEIEHVKESERKRFRDSDVVDQIVILNQQLRKIRWEFTDIRRQINENQRTIADCFKNKESQRAQELIRVNHGLSQREKEIDQQVKSGEGKQRELMRQVGNLPLPGVPVFESEQNNPVIRNWDGGVEVSVDSVLPHHKLLEQIGGYDQMRGVKVIGHRGYFLRGVGVKLNLALQRYALDFLEERNYTWLQPPVMIKEELMEKTAELEDFDQTLYRLKDGDGYLVATSEQPISAYHAGEALARSSLPIRYAGVSQCFRKEAGAHGKETWGIFRVHQFDKVEQFVLSAPEESERIHQEMLQVSEEFYQSLGLNYQIVEIVSGGLNNTAARKFDLEAWFPSYGEYKELVSCSNCTDYQSRDLKIKMDGEVGEFVHLLNGTLCATQRTICCLLENYQTDGGVVVPKVLRPYMGGLELMEWAEGEGG